MAWTTPITWTVGQLVTAAVMNTHIRDNENYLFTPTTWQAHQITTGTSMVTGAWTAVVLNSSDVDTDSLGFFAGGVKILTAGTYLVSGSVNFVNSTAGPRRGSAVSLNSTNVNGSTCIIPVSSTGNSVNIPIATCLIACAVNDVLKLLGFQDSGGAILTGVGASAQSMMTVLRRF